MIIIAGWNFGKFDQVREATFTRLSREEITVKMMSTNAHVGEARLEGKEWLRSISPSILWSQSSALWSSWTMPTVRVVGGTRLTWLSSCSSLMREPAGAGQISLKENKKKLKLCSAGKPKSSSQTSSVENL